MVRLSQLPWGLTVALMAAWTASATPTVNIGMKAAFPAGPYLLELLETWAGENSYENDISYFRLLDEMASGYFDSASTHQELYTRFVGALKGLKGGHITSPEQLSTFNLALSLRAAAPRIEAHYQYYTNAVEPEVGEHENCPVWALVDGLQYCTPSLDKPSGRRISQPLAGLPFDRTTGNGKDVILYADPTSPEFASFHTALSKRAHWTVGELKYRLRYRRNKDYTHNPLPVSGYGVELALKRTDYIVIDDREATHDSLQKSLHADLALDHEDKVTEIKPLSTSELATLGLKASTFIMQSDAPLDTLIKLTQDLPKFCTSIAAHEVSEEFLSEHTQNRALAGAAGLNHLWMNGLEVGERQIEPFTLVNMLRNERKLLRHLLDLGFNGKQAVSLLGHESIAAAKVTDEAPRFDWTDRSEDSKVIIWLNDLENDERYTHYPKSLNALLQRTQPGQIPPIAENIFHLVFPVDFSNAEDLAVFTQMLGLMQRGIPIRFGLAPLVSTNEAASLAKVGYHLLYDYGLDAFITYMSAFNENPDYGKAEKLFADVVKDHKLQADRAKTFTEVLKTDAYTQHITLARTWSRRLNANTAVRPVFADGVAIPREKQWMQSVSMTINDDLQKLQMAIYRGILKNNGSGYLLERASSKRNAYISPEDPSSLRMLDLGKTYIDHSDLLVHTAPVLESDSESKDKWATLAVIADLTSNSGRELLLSALKFKRNSPGVRLEIVHNPESDTDAYKVNAVAKKNTNELAKATCMKCVERALQTVGDERDNDFLPIARRFLSFAEITPGTRALILNGRIVGPISPDDSFEEEDFQHLLEFEQANRIFPVYAALEDLGLSGRLSNPIAAARITSTIALSTGSGLPEGIFQSASSIRTSSWYEAWSSSYTAIELGDAETATVHIVGLLNPLSEQGQRWAPILKVLSELDGVYLKIFVNPKEKIDELPVKRFYRYVLGSKPSFNEDGSLKDFNATFKGLPSETLLTTSMDVPPAWLVAPKASVHDLDNIKLSSIKGGVEAMYELENILIEGHSREGARSPPRGAQLVLATDKDPLLTDTIVMSNLGFFQFKANPGYYNIKLKEGRSAEIYTIESLGARGSEPVPGDEGTSVAVMDFQGTTLYPRLKRKPGMEKVDVLGDEEAPVNSLASKGLKFAGSLFGSSKKEVTKTEHAEINIFSVASGHLYERMLNIMMVSIMRNTKHTVKFWFIEQFLSPSFKEFIPHMAEEYGFRYEMVTYKWPHWLRQQKEKQREIWGYKILFLDVLFPLSLDKVIFVDADQIVRTDMIDLVNHDLEGAPYGFTPMCDSRTEMEGFRFWKQGYWASYLRGLPYHISALYVVDLRRFRELAAGDRLRQQYQTLSADKNSLSNLDQDLPNNMQFQIPIHSLPQEWLWCETWCSDESLSEAKTIDLCNNPETKEPKLDRARRQVPEWTVYDEEIAALDRRRKDGANKESVNTKSRRFEEPVHTKDEL